MSEPILATKLYRPPARPEIVSRPRLIERLDQGLHGKLTLISAPAGFGKTTIVGEWLTTCEQTRPDVRTAWLSLEERDSEPARFLRYLVAALQTTLPDIGVELLDLLQSAQPPPAHTALTALLNDVMTVSGKLVLVLDDYHEVDSVAVDDMLGFWIEHQPPQLHLVMTTREDPQLPLARLRARGQLTEVRAVELRFTHREAAAFLNEVMGLNISSKQVGALEARTEGWIAGLQLAALSLRGQDDASRFITAFAGDHRYIVDYLAEEVLQRQPEPVRDFLLKTSILERLSGPLCDALRFGPPQTPDLSPGESAGSEGDAGALLQTLESSNLFVIPLDDRRQWYRYHHLFADVLQARLMEEQPDQLPTLHRRASDWHEANGMRHDAVRHAFAAGALERAAALVELAWSDMDRNRQSAAWLAWAQALPEEMIHARPVLCAGYAWALLDAGELEAAELWLRQAERWLEKLSQWPQQRPLHAAEMVVADEEAFQVLPATIATARAYLAQAHGDVSGSITQACHALELLPQDDHLRRGIAGSLLGLALWTSGDLEQAYASFAGAMSDFERAGNVLFAITGTYILADIRMVQGRLRDAIEIYERSLQLAAGEGTTARQGTANLRVSEDLRGTAELHLGLSTLLREQGNLLSAAEHLRRSEVLAEKATLPRWEYHRRLAQSRAMQAQGDLDGALDALEEAERRYIRGPVPDMRPIPARKARLWAAQGRVSEALDWAREQALSVDDDLSYEREFEHVTLARVLVACYIDDETDDHIHEALSLLERLLKDADEGGRMGSVVEILLLQAMANEAQGNMRSARLSLERALTLAEPEGYVSVFLEEGPRMARLLAQASAAGIMPAYVTRLLAAFEGRREQREPEPAPGKASGVQALVEPLSPRELEILQLVALGLSNREIAERLFLALSTVKGHNRRIFAKMQVKRRTEAVARARALELL